MVCPLKHVHVQDASSFVLMQKTRQGLGNVGDVTVLFKHPAASSRSRAVLVPMKSQPQPQPPDSHANMAAATVAVGPDEISAAATAARFTCCRNGSRPLLVCIINVD